MSKQIQVELNKYFVHAIEAIQTGKNVFITGKAGTGKSTLLGYIRNNILPNAVVLAPTGVAAVNIHGQTIHSFFGFRPDVTVEIVKENKKNVRNKQLYKKLSTLIIDEVSMVRADLLDCINTFLKIHGPKKVVPFGGVQMIFIGDLYQLPPVVGRNEETIFHDFYESPYFFSSRACAGFPLEMIELEKIYRQKDETFIKILNGIRNRSIDETLLSVLNRRVDPTFKPTKKIPYIHLVTTNAHASEINNREQEKLRGEPFYFDGIISGEFDQKSLPAPKALVLRNGAQIMLTNNDIEGRWINGTVGVVSHIEQTDEGICILVKLENGDMVDVWPNRWDMYTFRYDAISRKIESDIVGSFTQYPLILAWAITIHKSQGKTFERVIVDMQRGAFAHGQTYVALSRATSLDGLVLTVPIQKKHALLDWRVVHFLTRFAYAQAEELLSRDEKISIIENAIEHDLALQLVYLKSSDEKSRRIIVPREVGQMIYAGKEFLGLSAYDTEKKDVRVFRVDRILELSESPQ
jgi:ATP-dependent DNA helicase PIF1